jgi:hypothetical protein
LLRHYQLHRLHRHRCHRGLFWDKKKISTDWEMVFELLTSRLLGEHGGLGGFQGYFCIKAPCDVCDG